MRLAFFILLTILLPVVGLCSADDSLIWFHTDSKEPDCYADGSVVMDGECYALVWSQDGEFNGFLGDGRTADTNDEVVVAAPIARDGHCPDVLFQIDRERADRLSIGKYALVLLDTRVTESGTTRPYGMKDGTLRVINGYGIVASDIKVSNAVVADFSNSVRSDTNTVAGIGIVEDHETQQPMITGINVCGDDIILNVENLSGYIRISEGRDAGSFHNIGGAVRCKGKKEDIVIVLPRIGTSGFFKASRSL